MLVVRFTELPKPIRVSTAVYGASILLYNAAAAYVDSASAIAKFKNGELKEEPGRDGKPITTKWEAAKFGANQHLCENFWNSVIWPVKTISNVVPLIAVGLN